MTSLFRQGVISTALTLFTSLAAASSAEINKHLELGSKFLAKAQFADALTQYHAAVELDPNNYQALFRRATTYLAMGRGKAALPDLDRVLELKPDFSHARIHRGNILLKQGELDGAENDFNVVLSSEPNNEEISEKVDQIGHLRQFAHQVKMAYDSGDCSTAEHYISQIIEVMLWDASLYRMRAKCLEERGEIKKAIHDMRSISKLTSDSTDVMFETSQLFYKIGEIDECLTVIRECLKLNPDHKLCYPFYKKIRKVVRMRDGMKQKMAEEDWIGCLQKGQEIMKFDTTPSVQLNVYRSTCKCNREADHIAEAITECSEVLKEDPTDVEMLCERAEAHLIAEDYDAAINDFKAGQEINPDHSCVKDGVDRANKLKTQASKRDYYKILGVKRNASKREITKAYRKLAQKWHPDNFSDEVEKKKAEKKFIDIAAAKEVLQDDGRQFDQGIDPLDPESQRQGGHGGFHHGFPHGFHHFGGGGGGGGEYTYKFHF